MFIKDLLDAKHVIDAPQSITHSEINSLNPQVSEFSVILVVFYMWENTAQEAW